jgi:transcriptional regulator with XRE-family HTH domain
MSPKKLERILPNRIREWRLTRQMKPRELAARMQSNKQTLSRHETGKNEMTLATLERYAEVLGVYVEQLLPEHHRAPRTLESILDEARELAAKQGMVAATAEGRQRSAIFAGRKRRANRAGNSN